MNALPKLATFVYAFLVLLMMAYPMAASPPCPFTHAAKGAHGDLSSCNVNHRCTWYFYNDTCTNNDSHDTTTKCIAKTPGDPAYDLTNCVQDSNGNWICDTNNIVGSGGTRNNTYETVPC